MFFDAQTYAGFIVLFSGLFTTANIFRKKKPVKVHYELIFFDGVFRGYTRQTAKMVRDLAPWELKNRMFYYQFNRDTFEELLRGYPDHHREGRKKIGPKPGPVMYS
jgi:hypothetical protein